MADFLTREELHPVIVDHDQDPIALDDGPFGCEVEGYHRDVFLEDVDPDVQLGPVRERKDTDAFTIADFAVVDAPELRALVLWVPAMITVTE